MTRAISGVTSACLSNKLRQPMITFQYADDTLLLLSATPTTIRALLVVIHCFSASSGLAVNFAKSSFVPLSIPPHHLCQIESLLTCKKQALPILYLGMPLSVKAPKRQDFMPLLTKLEQRLDGWKSRFISRAGKLQLVKTVLSSIPAYFMSSFALPKWLLERIDKIRRQFLWSRPQAVAPIHLVNWQVASLPLPAGGLGIINLRLQNIALLLRWWWRLYSNDHKLWAIYATLIYGRQRPAQGPLIFSSRGSFFWKAIIKIKPIFHSSTRIQLISGLQTSFWHDSWAGRPLAVDQCTPLPRKTISVHEAKTCFHSLLSGPLTLQQSEAFNKLQSFSPLLGPDILVWRLSNSGKFTASSIYKVLSQGGKTRTVTSSIWKAKVPPSMRLFFFFLLHNRLLTHDVMAKRNLPHTPGCVMCSQCPTETATHLFFLCPYALSIWNSVSASLGFTVLHTAETPILTYLSSIPADKDCRKTWLAYVITASSIIWRERNARTFTHKATPPFILAPRILQDAAMFLSYCK